MRGRFTGHAFGSWRTKKKQQTRSRRHSCNCCVTPAGSCLRVLEDKEKAADAVQETFLQLLRDAGRVRGSLSGWLHLVATRKAVDQIRQNCRRKRREAKYAADKPLRTSRWSDISPHVDEALEELDEPERQVLLKYFFEGHSMTRIAEQEGISHQTVSRQIDSAVARLRGKLHRRGVLVAPAVLGSLLAEHTVKAAPAAVLKELAKMALAGGEAATSATATAAASEATAKLAATGALAGAKVKILLAAAAAATIGGALTYNYVITPATKPPKPGRADLSTPAAPELPATAQPENTVAGNPSGKPSAQPQANTEEDEPKTAWTFRSTKSEGQAEPLKAEDKIDLSTPEGTVRSFIRMFALGDKEAVLACFMAGGVDYEDITEILYPDPSSRTYKTNMMLQGWLSSFDPNAEMPIVRTEQTAEGLSVTWLATFKRDFTTKGGTFHAGETMELDATLKKVGDKWLIDNF